MVAGAMLAAATLVSEDAATLTAGALVAAHSMSVVTASAWVAFGIWVGDLGLFGIGRVARHLPAVAAWVNRRWPTDRMAAVAVRFNRGAALAVVSSRFMPGTRVLVYVAAGLLQVNMSTFAVSAAVASMTWTFAIVSAVGSIGFLW